MLFDASRCNNKPDVGITGIDGVIVVGFVKPIPKPLAPPRLFEKLNPKPLLPGISAYATKAIGCCDEEEVFRWDRCEPCDDIERNRRSRGTRDEDSICS